MNQEDKKELLLKDLSARLSYGVKGIITFDDDKNIFTIKGIFNILFLSDTECCHIEDFKPYLRPMSSMTEEEAKEIAVLHDINIKDILLVKVTGDYIDVIVDDGFSSIETITIWYDELISSIECFDWLNRNHFDYRGLIRMDLALEAPDDMYRKGKQQ